MVSQALAVMFAAVTNGVVRTITSTT